MQHPTRTSTPTPVPDFSIHLKPAGWRDLMAQTGITTQRQLAERLGVSRAAVSRIFNGESKPSADFIGQVMGVFGSLIPFPRLFDVRPAK